ncbi:YpdA family putative bacillithiol disulfide reductase [Bacillus sp. FJAT-44742]|uniref:YpdA family putative bacillithiol disulfide reductase n=1 Tax=Bacillus sp. FJAT-44742 TaxID=2014005 RepID=UPI000C24AE0F|nr:YpdA family putative bacillithiol disulfide reductase [Bacillus sp. FJAT-44742]
MIKETVIIIGAGPCGLAAAISCQEKGLDPLIIEKENVVHTIFRYPTHQTFFSSSDKLEIGDLPFVTEERKPKRNQALSYYREVVKRKKLRIHSFEEVKEVCKQEDDSFLLLTEDKKGEAKEYKAPFVITATGYYDNPNYLGIQGEESEHVFHYFKEAHPFFKKNVVVIGGKNSAVDATLELEKAGANVTVLYRGGEMPEDVKPWILPEFLSLLRHNKIKMHYHAVPEEITENNVHFIADGEQQTVEADFVLAMTGYHPDHGFLTKMGVEIEMETGRPVFDEETMETNVENLFIAGVIAAGNNANEIFIENGRFHGDAVSKTIYERLRSRDYNTQL